MKHRCYVLGVLALLTAASSARSQETADGRNLTFGLGGGVGFPVGDFGDIAETGFHAQGMVGFTIPGLPIRLRGDLMYHSFGGNSVDFGGSSATYPDTRIIAGLVNGSVSFSRMRDGTSPDASGGRDIYIIGGLGVYNLDSESTADFESASETRFGVNVGAGMRFDLSGLDTFVEARFHHVFTKDESLTMIPITFGIMFGR